MLVLDQAPQLHQHWFDRTPFFWLFMRYDRLNRFCELMEQVTDVLICLNLQVARETDFGLWLS